MFNLIIYKQKSIGAGCVGVSVPGLEILQPLQFMKLF
jgi:hypothetical protein